MTTVVQTTLHWIFSCVILSGASQTKLHWVFPVQCCSTSIKTTLNRIFSGAMLSGSSGTTLHKVFLCAILSHIEQNYLWQVLKTRNCLCNIDPECIDIFLYEKNLHIIALIYLGQNCTVQSPVQHWPRVHEQHCTGKWSTMLSESVCQYYTRKTPMQCWPIANRALLWGK